MTSYFTKPVLDVSQNRRAMILGLVYAGVIAASFYLAYEVRFDFIVDTQSQADRLHLLLPVVGIKLVTLVTARQLGSMMTYFSIPDLVRVVIAMAVASLVLLLMRLAAGGAGALAAPRGVLLIDFMLCTGGLCAGRLATRVFRERLSGNHKQKNGGVVQQQRIAIVGAGDAGASLAKEFLTNPSRGFKPVAFFDDDIVKHGKLIHGVPVIGRPEEIHAAKGVTTLAKVVIAMPTASAKRTREVIKVMTDHGLKVETLPSMADLAAGRVRASRIRPVEVQDLLGREMVDLDSTGIRNSIQGRVVLVTGAGGSIGSELCRQIAALAPKRLLLVEQFEGALFLIEQELNELGTGTVSVPLVGDILDEERMRYIFSHYEPDVVFHAAAHKHVYMMERQPAEAIRNNVLGTRLLAEIAADTGVESFVMISTDKAINPTNVMGATKRLAEVQVMAVAAGQKRSKEGQMAGWSEGERDQTSIQTEAAGAILRAVAKHANAEVLGAGAGSVKAASAASEPRVIGFNPSTPAAQVVGRAGDETSRTSNIQHSTSNHDGSSLSTLSSQLSTPSQLSTSSSARKRATKFMAVRFGNVLGSSGSVIPIFKRQIANGGPVTVTHPEVTRYFMTIPEAVGLVLQASILGKGGEIFVLDMGQPVKIVDLAKQMIELSGFKVGDDIEIKFTGLKPGEKLYEELQHKSEHHSPTAHPRIMRFTSSTTYSESGMHELRQRLYELDSNQLKQLLKRLVPEYTPYLD